MPDPSSKLGEPVLGQGSGPGDELSGVPLRLQCNLAANPFAFLRRLVAIP